MDNFDAFENDTQSITVGPGEGLVFENGKETINIYGDFEITQDSSKEQLDELINLLTEIKKTLRNK